MNNVLLTLNVISAQYQETTSNSICAVAECVFSQVDQNNRTLDYHVKVRCFGANAANLAALPQHSSILVYGSLWINGETWIECNTLLINYAGPVVNKFSIVGHQGKDPEHKVVNDKGDAVCKTSLAINRNKQENAYWYNIQAWGKRAELLQQYGKKGQLLGVDGSLEISQWTSEETGEIRQTLKVNASQIKLLSPKEPVTIETTATLVEKSVVEPVTVKEKKTSKKEKVVVAATDVPY